MVQVGTSGFHGSGRTLHELVEAIESGLGEPRASLRVQCTCHDLRHELVEVLGLLLLLLRQRGPGRDKTVTRGTETIVAGAACIARSSRLFRPARVAAIALKASSRQPEVFGGQMMVDPGGLLPFRHESVCTRSQKIWTGPPQDCCKEKMKNNFVRKGPSRWHLV